jgi:predicted house-cleaning noncanonical NTP pyrophosphatase (MazG superfamily)
MSKLVRDLIPNVVPADKQHLYKFSEVNEEQYTRLLKNKLLEEVNEYLEAENKEELADILEVMDALMKFMNFEKEEVLAIQKKKREERGGFEKRILMERV